MVQLAGKVRGGVQNKKELKGEEREGKRKMKKKREVEIFF
jgi:hypothetical protein